VGEEGVVLEDGVDVALVGWNARYVLALEPDGTRGGSFEACDHPQRGRLAAARRSEHREELTRTDREVRVGDRDVVVEALRDVIDLDDGAARVAGRPALAGRGNCRGGVGAGQDDLLVPGTKAAPPRADIARRYPCAVGKPSPMSATFASDSASNLHLDRGFLLWFRC
jgi:hypothetical protein